MSFVRDFLTRWNFEVDDKALDNADRKLSELGKRMKGVGDGWDNVTEKAAEFGKAVAVVSAAVTAAVGGFFLITRSTAEFAGRINDTATALGVTTSQLQKLQYAATVGGASVEKLEAGLRVLTRNSFAASDGTGEQAEAFQKLGVAIRYSNGEMRNTDELLIDIADSFSNLQDGTEKSALAMKVFGKEGASLLPFLNKGRGGIQALMDEAESLGIVLSQDMIDASGAFNDSLNRLIYVFNGVKNTLGAALLPIFQGYITSIFDAIRLNSELIKTKVDEWAKRIGAAMNVLWRVLQFGFKVVDRIISLFGGWESASKLALAALALFGSAKILMAFNALAKAVMGLAFQLNAAGMAALKAQVIAFAIPLAIGAAIAAVGLLIEDIVTFFQGGESAFGKFVKLIQDNLDTIENAFAAIGITVVELWLTPLRTVLEYLNKIIKTFTGVDMLNRFGILTGEAGEEQRSKLIKAGIGAAFSPIRNANIDERGILQTPENRVGPIRAVGPNQPAITARPDVARAGGGSSAGPTTLQNNVTVNASGLTQDQASAAIADALRRSNDDFLRKSGQKSQPKIRE